MPMLRNMKTESITTRWWWVRHAPVINPDSLIYGASDLPCHTDSQEEFAHLADCLPVTPHWLISPLQRTRQTAEAILAANVTRHGAPEFRVIPEFIEQSLGRWEGFSWNDYYAARRNKQRHPFWAAEAHETVEGGNSYVEIFHRAQNRIETLTEELKGHDIIMVGHGGVIRAAVAQALGLPPESALMLQILNLSLTRIDYRIESNGRKFWRVITLNRTLGPPPLSYGHHYEQKVAS